MGDFTTARRPVARRAHSCDECGQPINVGSRYACASGRYDGEFYRSRRHIGCAWLNATVNRTFNNSPEWSPTQELLRDILAGPTHAARVIVAGGFVGLPAEEQDRVRRCLGLWTRAHEVGDG